MLSSAGLLTSTNTTSPVGRVYKSMQRFIYGPESIRRHHQWIFVVRLSAGLAREVAQNCRFHGLVDVRKPNFASNELFFTHLYDLDEKMELL
jgi:hypothetical protein